jgi:hypothetical protein
MISSYGGPDAGELLKLIDPTVQVSDSDDDMIYLQLVRTPRVFAGDARSCRGN